jgi:streptogramin lyase
VITGDGYVWVHGWLSAIDPAIGTGAEDRLVVLRIDPRTDEAVGDPTSMEWFYPFAFGEGGVWFVDKAGPAVSRLNTQTLEIDHSVAVDAVAQDSTVHAAFDMGTGTIWVANYEDTITRIDLR